MFEGAEYSNAFVDRLASYEDTNLTPEEIESAFSEKTVIDGAEKLLGVKADRLHELADADRDGRCLVLGEPVNNAYKSAYIADDGKTLKPLEKSDLLPKRGMAVLVASLDGKPMLYGMDRVAAVIDTVPIYGESHMGIVAIYGRSLTLGDSDYGITWVAYDYNSSETPNNSNVHCVDANKMGEKDEDDG